MRPYDMGNNFMYNDMTMGMGLNPFSSDSILGEQNEDDIDAPRRSFGMGYPGFGGFGGYGGYGGFGGFGPSPYGFGMSPYGFGGGYGGVGPYSYGGPGSIYGVPGFGGQGGYNALTPAYGGPCPPNPGTP